MVNESQENPHRSDLTRLVSEGLSLLSGGKPAQLLGLIAGVGPRHLGDPRILSQKAYAHAMLGQIAEALSAAHQASQGHMSEWWAFDLLGNAFVLCHRPEDAYAAFARAQSLAPDRPEILLNLATAAGFLGLKDEAEAAYDRIIAAKPDMGEAYLNRSLLRRQTPGDNHLSQLRRALESAPMGWSREVHLHYALGKELEDLGDYDAAFASIAQGAALRRRHMRYSVSDDSAAMLQIAAAHDAKWCAPASPAQSKAGPIFVLGMPRSGSTLLERMLGRHTEVQSLGELQHFGQALIGTFRARMHRMPSSKAELIDISADLDPATMGDAYLSAVAPLRNDCPRFVDKLPINFLYAGLIARALPTATLVHIRRRPLDLCFAIFKTLFRDAYPFSYDLAELGAYHRAYATLMDHWRAVLSDRLVEVDYEDLVRAPMETMEALLGRLDLPFEEGCLSPERDGTAVMTASASQVRLPIHAGSVGSADRYRAHLAPLISALDLHGQDHRGPGQ